MSNAGYVTVIVCAHLNKRKVGVQLEENVSFSRFYEGMDVCGRYHFVLIQILKDRWCW